MDFIAKMRNLIGYRDEDEIPPDEGAVEDETQTRDTACLTRAQVVVAKPTQFEDARCIVDHLKEHRVIVLNLEGAERALVCRVLDFLAGAVYGLEGAFRRVATDTYIITPKGVEFLGGTGDRGRQTSGGELYFPEFQVKCCG